MFLRDVLRQVAVRSVAPLQGDKGCKTQVRLALQDGAVESFLARRFTVVQGALFHRCLLSVAEEEKGFRASSLFKGNSV